MATYPIQQSPYSMQVINDAKQAVPISMSHPFFRTQYGGPPMKQHPVSVPSIGSFLAGTTEPWYVFLFRFKINKGGGWIYVLELII